MKQGSENLEFRFGNTDNEQPILAIAAESLKAISCQSASPRESAEWLRGALDLTGTDTPFPWQEELLNRFLRGDVPRALDLPTGLGKTAVMAVWLVAKALGAPVPRRLGYVVDRRTVVDQATATAVSLRAYVESNLQLKHALDLREHPLPISTLRGQFADNREWLDDPTGPAIIVGTVDMVGSRLLFEGYGVSRKMRPYHAGVLGCDTLVVLDEAHLVPPFEKLIEAIADDHAAFGPRDEAVRALVPSFQLLSLSATGRTRREGSVGLSQKDLQSAVVRTRLNARKRLALLAYTDAKKLPELLAAKAWELSGEGRRPVRCIVFCDTRNDAEAAAKAVRSLAAKAEAPVHSELFVGARRVFERQRLARWLEEHGFVAGSAAELDRPAFLFATSAGEVGVDLDADHMVSDLVEWERMVQRLGRVNRRGTGEAEVIVFFTRDPDGLRAARKRPDERSEKETKAARPYERMRMLRKPLQRLPLRDGGRDASPGAIRDLKLRARTDARLAALLEAATSPPPLRPALSRALIDAWSMTSLEQHTGRPDIAPWLRGWEEKEEPQTRVVWRMHLPATADGRVPSATEITTFFEAAPPHLSEVLETETHRVVEWLEKRASAALTLSPRAEPSQESAETEVGSEHLAPLRGNDVAAIVLTSAGELRSVLRLSHLDPESASTSSGKDAKKKFREQLHATLAGATLVVDSRLTGLSTDGLLDSECDAPVRTPETVAWSEPDGSLSTPLPVPFRIRLVVPDTGGVTDATWRTAHTFVVERSEDGPTRSLLIEKRIGVSTTEDSRSLGRPQLLVDHRRMVARRIRRIARRLGLPREYRRMLLIAALLHDEGKRAPKWQRAFRAHSDGVYAKTRGFDASLLDGYRHEFGSLLAAERDPRIQGLPVDLRDLALHLIAAHHGFARPVIRPDGCEDAPPSALERHVADAALRFARLQKLWGPWGLAWWETLLRTADQGASREHDRSGTSLQPGGA